ncbi:UPF0052-domain-containing protein [Hysterangium stoloniferum]|nr:UPF0052-domain-containing protein [Hysterangium stoloniferum]
MEKSYLSPNQFHTTGSSPTSSVFDLPIQNHSPLRRNDDEGSSARLTDNGNAAFIVISGGTGCNSLCSAFGQSTCYVLPVSDDGGSSSEIIRVIGNHFLLGDVRSRLIRLIPQAPENSPLAAIRALLSHRLSGNSSQHEARDEWRSIVEGNSKLWQGIPPDRKETIRGFLVHFESLVLKRAQKNFSFQNGSVGNYLLAAAQDFFRSLPSAIFLFSSITNSQANILPVLITNHTVTIAAELEDSSTIVGQCSISHPMSANEHLDGEMDASFDPDVLDDERLLPVRNRSYAKLSGTDNEYEPLPSPISRLYYINPYGHEIQPYPNPEFLAQLSSRDVLVYSCGSLWTSVMPCLALRGVGAAIARSKSLRAKVLLLNSKNDRETHGLDGLGYIQAIVGTLRRQCLPRDARGDLAVVSKTEEYPHSAFITHLAYLRGSMVPVDVEKIHAIGVKCIAIESGIVGTEVVPQFTALSVQKALSTISQEKPLDI